MHLEDALTSFILRFYNFARRLTLSQAGGGGYFARGYVPCLKTRIPPTYGFETPYSFLTFIMQHFSEKKFIPNSPSATMTSLN